MGVMSKYRPEVKFIKCEASSSVSDVHVWSQLKYLPKVQTKYFDGDIFAPWPHEITNRVDQLYQCNDHCDVRVSPSVAEVIEDNKAAVDLLKHECSKQYCGAEEPWNVFVYWENSDQSITKLPKDETLFNTDFPKENLATKGAEIHDAQEPPMTEEVQGQQSEVAIENGAKKKSKRGSVFRRFRKGVNRMVRGVFGKKKQVPEYVVDDDCKPYAVINGAVIYDPELKCELQY